MKIIVIAPAQGPRNPQLLCQLAGLPGHQPHTFDAVFLDEFPAEHDRHRSRAINNRDLTLGEIGCALSHRTVWEQIAASSDEWACVLEDDASITDQQALSDLLDRIATSVPAPSGSVIALYTDGVLVGAEVGEFQRAVSEPYTTVAYCISSEAARRLAEANRDLGFTADWPRRSGVEFAIAPPGIVGPDAPSSLIGGDRRSSALDRPIGRRNLGLAVITNRLALYSGVDYLRHRRHFDGVRDYYRLVLRHRVLHHLARLVGRPIDPAFPGIRVLRSPVAIARSRVGR